ncbi:MAG: hypothetical protein ACYDDQ_09730 [Vulcanimicrobiaceae bacterium]
MFRPRVESERGRALVAPIFQTPALYPVLPEDELETPPLPQDHPQWVKDAAAVSKRARRLIASLKPVVVRILNFWDHHVRSIVVRGRTVSVDAAGSYRID